MKLSVLSCILAILASSTHVLAEDAEPIKADSQPTPLPGTPTEPEDADLERRQGAPVANPAVTQGPLQVPPVTTYSMITAIGGKETWMGFPFTQTFAPVPDQLPGPGVGTIGLGTHQKARRDALPAETGLAGRVRI